MRRDCQSALPVRARRGALSSAETLAFEAHLAGCQSCRDDHGVLSVFADPGTVDIRDGARLERLAAAARQWTEARHPNWQGRPRGRRSLGRRLKTLAVAATVILAASTASAAAWWFRHPPAQPSATAAGPATPPAARVASGTGHARTPSPPTLVASAAPDETPAELPAPPIAPVAGATATARTRDVPAPARHLESATALLQQAGEWRRAGATARATALYRRLQRDYPATSEAVLAAVPLATLLRDGGFPRAAIVEFDRYLASSRGGALIPEALYGRARALAVLGDRQEEQRTWQRLLDDFPNSAYAPLGRRRLAELR